MTIDDIEALISKHGSITAQPLEDLVVTVVSEAIEAEREACAQTIERARLRLGLTPFVVNFLAAAVRKRGEQE
jgi:hypothetical protein